MAIGLYKTHFIHKFFSLPEQMKHILLFSLLRTAFVSVMGVFLPVYILKLTNSLEYVGLFFALTYGVFGFMFLYLIQTLLNKMSIEELQSISIISGILQSIIVALIPWFQNYLLIIIVLLSMLSSISLIFYWIPQHVVLGLFSRKNSEAEDFAKIGLISTIFSILVPIISSIIIYFVGFGMFYILFALCYLVSILGIKHLLKNKTRISVDIKNINLNSMFILEGIWWFTAMVFLIYVYYVFGNIVIYGSLKSISVLVASISAYLFSIFVDAHKDYSIGSLGILVRSTIMSIAIFSIVPDIIGVCLLLLSLISPLADIPYFGYIYKKTKKEGIITIFEREYNMCFGRTILSILLILLSKSVNLIFIIGLISCILLGYIYYIKSKEI